MCLMRGVGRRGASSKLEGIGEEGLLDLALNWRGEEGLLDLALNWRRRGC